MGRNPIYITFYTLTNYRLKLLKGKVFMYKLSEIKRRSAEEVMARYEARFNASPKGQKWKRLAAEAKQHHDEFVKQLAENPIHKIAEKPTLATKLKRIPYVLGNIFKNVLKHVR